MRRIQKIVSGGQTGVDRGALDAALSLATPTGGWVPKGRLAEDGRVPDEYPLQETALIISHGPLHGGSHVTLEVAIDLGRPCKHLDLSALSLSEAIDAAQDWIDAHGISTLNVAGPRHSEDQDGYRVSHAITTALLTRTRGTK